MKSSAILNRADYPLIRITCIHQSYNILPKISSHHLQAPHFASKPIIDIYTIFIPSSTPLEAFSPAIESFNYIKFQPTKSHKYKLSILQNTIHTLIAKTE